MKIKFYLFIACLFISPHIALANVSGDLFLQRIDEARRMVIDHDGRTADTISKELRDTDSPEGNLRIYEAVAATYRDLVKSGKFPDDTGKKKLYDQIRMNMAYIQFGGDPGYRGGKKINRWIRQTLVKYLPQDLLDNKKMFYSTDEWSKK